ncbi:hypothetical protein PLICRDRAFT_175558 [Plicaturopsis crispa FD-325 SS-3]|nr:hypothetical protein PLICRDRAFT_175558 [Plicaturopsis crispa FD-325 SS-3]
MSTAPTSPRAEPDPTILRSVRTNSPLSPRDASNEKEDALVEVNARFEKLGRPQMSLEDCYGPGARSEHHDHLARPSQPGGIPDLVRHNGLLTSQRDVAGRRIDAIAQDTLPFLYQQQFVPVFGPGLVGPYPNSLINRELVASNSKASGVLPEYVVYRKAATFPSEKKPPPASRRPRRRSVTPLRRPRQDQPDHSRDLFRDVVVNHWLTGSNYGPVLPTLLLPHVDACPELNPLLCPPLLDKTFSHRVNWEMLFPSSYARCSHTVSEKTWSEHLHSPATFPRLRKIFIVSRSFPWIIHINPEDFNVGITCGDVLDEIYSYLYVRVVREEIRVLPPSDLNAFDAAYHHNRTRRDEHGEPTVSLMRHSAAMRRLDWLSHKTFFGGLSRDDAYIAERFSVAMPGAFVLHSQDTAIKAA